MKKVKYQQIRKAPQFLTIKMLVISDASYIKQVFK